MEDTSEIQEGGVGRGTRASVMSRGRRGGVTTRPAKRPAPVAAPRPAPTPRPAAAMTRPARPLALMNARQPARPLALMNARRPETQALAIRRPISTAITPFKSKRNEANVPRPAANTTRRLTNRPAPPTAKKPNMGIYNKSGRNMMSPPQLPGMRTGTPATAAKPAAPPKRWEDQDAYERLGVSKGASDAEIRKAYLQKAKETHPNKGGNTKRFQELQDSYGKIKDKKGRDAYNAETAAKPTRPPGGPPSVARPSVAPKPPVVPGTTRRNRNAEGAAKPTRPPGGPPSVARPSVAPKPPVVPGTTRRNQNTEGTPGAKKPEPSARRPDETPAEAVERTSREAAEARTRANTLKKEAATAEKVAKDAENKAAGLDKSATKAEEKAKRLRDDANAETDPKRKADKEKAAADAEADAAKKRKDADDATADAATKRDAANKKRKEADDAEADAKGKEAAAASAKQNQKRSGAAGASGAKGDGSGILGKLGGVLGPFAAAAGGLMDKMMSAIREAAGAAAAAADALASLLAALAGGPDSPEAQEAMANPEEKCAELIAKCVQTCKTSRLEAVQKLCADGKLDCLRRNDMVYAQCLEPCEAQRRKCILALEDFAKKYKEEKEEATAKAQALREEVIT